MLTYAQTMRSIGGDEPSVHGSTSVEYPRPIRGIHRSNAHRRHEKRSERALFPYPLIEEVELTRKWDKSLGVCESLRTSRTAVWASYGVGSRGVTRVMNL